MHRLLLATHNRHKAEELQTLLRDVEVEVLTLEAFPHVGDIEEDSDTLEGNALKKAREVYRQTSLPSLADDSGLEVDALNGKPGVYSSRFAGPKATYADNVAKLLRHMHGVPAFQRTARFRSVLAFVAPNNVERLVEGVCHGTITEEPRGTGGFGYDPVFLPNGHQRTYAEMPMELKNTISHRAKAFKAMESVLVEYFRRPPSES